MAEDPENGFKQRFQRAFDSVLGGLRELLAMATGRSHAVLWSTLGLAGVALLFAAAITYVWIVAGLPRNTDAQSLWSMNRQPGVTFLDARGELLAVRGAYYGEAARLEDLPPYVSQAFLAIEDRRFFTHRGVDRQALIRAALVNLFAGRTKQGGSTITQQLVKNLFLEPDRTIRRKVQEMLLAGRIEKRVPKQDILELYLNRVFLGPKTYGIDAAAKRYFDKRATDLTAPEAALLAGLPKAPSDLIAHPERAKARQELVLRAMREAGFITEEDRRRFAAAPIKYKKGVPNEGVLGYALDAAVEQAPTLGGRLPKDLVITLSIDPRLQSSAARIVKDFTARAAPKKKPLQAALIALDRNGAIRALVGGTDYSKSKYNRAIQAKRQPGSAFKTFVYAAALEQNLSPDDVRYDEPITIDGWRPKNYGEGYRGAVTLRTAFAQSLNTVAAQIADEIGTSSVARLAKRFGITTPLQEVPSLALGSSEVTLLDMTQAYSVLMRDGDRIDAYLILSIRDTRGRSYFQRAPTQAYHVYDPALAHQMNGMMGLVIQNGTGTRARLPGRDAAGKTGTSQDWRDAWFIGYTSDFTAGVWMGYDDDSETPHITGGSAPADIWAEFMEAAHRDLPATKLPGVVPFVRTKRQIEVATFYDALTSAFTGAPARSDAEPEPDFFVP